MEFVALEQGLRILGRLKIGATLVEGDSQFAITAEKRLHSVLKLSKVTKHWRLPKVTELIAEYLSCLDGIILQEVRRKENIVTNHLANCGKGM